MKNKEGLGVFAASYVGYLFLPKEKSFTDLSHLSVCLQVMGAYFEKLGSKSFAVYSIAVTDTESRTWFVKRRYFNSL